jgi:hypothetical protein
MHRARLAATLAATLATALLLGGCADDPEPKVEPSETPSSATTASHGPLDPEDVVRSWVDAQNVALTSGDTTELQRLSDPNCVTCQKAFIQPIEDVYNAGGRFETEGWRVTATTSRAASGGTVEVDADVEIPGGRTYAEANADPVSYESEHRRLQFRIRDEVVSFVGFLS